MIEKIFEHKEEIFAIIGALLIISKFIARLTPTDKDDKIVEKFRKFFECISDLGLPDRKK